MRILYGVSGEGFGHSSRALVIADYLKKKGHEVIIMTYGQAYSVLKKRFKVFRVRGLSLIFEKSILKKRKTLIHNLNNFPKNLFIWRKFHSLMKKFNPDLCITDMEPIVPILRYWYKKPLICIDNQHRMTNLEITVPSKYKSDFILAEGVTDAFVKKADYFIVASFSKARIKKKFIKNTFIVNPIIRKQVQQLKNKCKYGDKILVYLTKKDERIIGLLRKINEQFVIYGYDKNKNEDNLHFRTKDNFLKDLTDCKAIIATAGFTLMSEAIFLKKPFLALPLIGQFEQMLNALFLKKAGFGEFSEHLNEKEIVSFLNNLEIYKRTLKKYNPDYSDLYKVLDRCLKSFE